MTASWLTSLPGAALMRDTDHWAIDELGIPSLELMERAGAGLARVVYGVAPDGPVLVLCGHGNNGGDGLVAARLLHEAGREVHVRLVSGQDLVGDALSNLERLPVGVGRELGAAGTVPADGVVVDALLGTGATGEPRGAVAGAIAAIADGVTVVAADVPSGVDASTGEVAGVAVTAAATATFHAAKPGLWIAPGKRHAGRVEVIDIGIPDGAPGVAGAGLLTAAVLDEVPRRDGLSTKFTSGRVVVAGGSQGLTGAPCLTALGAMRAGAGYVTVCVPASLSVVFETRLLEAMTMALPDRHGELLVDGAPTVTDALARRPGVLALGPGLGSGDDAASFARRLAKETAGPLVLDADGLRAHAGRLAELARRRGPTVLTPHEGELAGLLGWTREEVAARRMAAAREAASVAGAIVVLKGDDTLIADPQGGLAVSPGDAPALATAGTGDVLTGVIAALLAGGMAPFRAACAGVWLHREAGRAVAMRRRPESVVAGDIIDALGSSSHGNSGPAE